jgi:phosphate transport system substrate-binding protein
LFVVAIAALSCAGCAKVKARYTEIHDRFFPQPDEVLLVAGSSTMRQFTTPLVEEFKKQNGHTIVENQAGGASAGVIALKRGAIDVAMLTRDLKEEEDDPMLRNYLVARDAIAILVNPQNPVGNLTLHQLKKIYEKEITNWKEVGGTDAPIDILVREPGATAQKSIRDYVLGGDDMPDEPAERIMKSHDAMIAGVKSNPNAIGFEALAGISRDVKPITVNGVAIANKTVLSGRYPLSRSFYLVLYGSSTPAAERFVAFALSKEGQDIFVKQDGLLAVY